eukprot:CAMPEP_0182465788 /NCGR_PEP_ID=MMETSP1319-20130603/10702_1 /TAXON_ID=172717 /ORGANISM="Bolidomonas pacifica, Strain RCC208" /LENGTH=140 /DNA_ID=CAMNT_0024665641 /DNA_START=80 /DNA_END=502 /DNA_ORIENTATION=-
MVNTAVDQDAGDEVQEVPLPMVTGSILAKVLEFCTYHHENGPMPDIQKPLQNDNISEAVPEWDANYVNTLEQPVLLELILAANYMDVEPLLDLTCAKFASFMVGKSKEELNALFEIDYDSLFTPEEEQRVREENRWCENV